MTARPIGVRDTNRVKDSDGYGPVKHGGPLNIRRGTIAYTDEGTAKRLFTLPKGARIVYWLVNVSTAFDDTGTDLLDLGDGTTADRFAANLDLASAGQLNTGFDETEIDTELTVDTDVEGTYTGANTNAANGAASVICGFVML